MGDVGTRGKVGMEDKVDLLAIPMFSAHSMTFYLCPIAMFSKNCRRKIPGDPTVHWNQMKKSM